MRLIKKASMQKKAGMEMTLSTFIAKSGSHFELGVRAVNHKPWYHIRQYHDWDVSSIYDGDDFDRAIKLYMELLTAFKGVSETEAFKKNLNKIQEKIDKNFGRGYDRTKFIEYHNLLQKSPKFLGNNDF